MFTSQHKHEYMQQSDSQWSMDKKLRCPSASRWKNPDKGASVSIKSKWSIKLYKEKTWKKLKWKSLRKICKPERETLYTILWRGQNYRRIVRSESRSGEEERVLLKGREKCWLQLDKLKTVLDCSYVILCDRSKSILLDCSQTSCN